MQQPSAVENYKAKQFGFSFTLTLYGDPRKEKRIYNSWQ